MFFAQLIFDILKLNKNNLSDEIIVEGVFLYLLNYNLLVKQQLLNDLLQMHEKIYSKI